MLAKGRRPTAHAVRGGIAANGTDGWVEVSLDDAPDGDIEVVVRAGAGERTLSLQKAGGSIRYGSDADSQRNLAEAFDVRVEILP